MKQLILLFLFIGLFFSVSGQDYQLIKSNEQRIYGAWSPTNGLEVREVEFDGDSIFWLAPHWTKAVHFTECVYADSSSSLGRYLRIAENGITTIHTLADETITLHTHANTGDDPWLAYTAPDASWYLEAFVSELSWEDVLGTSDSVKTFNFEAYNADGTTMNQWITDQSIRIGRQMGLIEAPHIGIFPETTTAYGAYGFYGLVGIEGVAGMQDLKWFDVHDFQVNDEIHVENISFSFGEGTVQHVLRKYLSRQDFADSIVYEVEVTRWFYQGGLQNITLHYQGTEIETQTIESHPAFDKLPCTPLIESDLIFGDVSGTYYQLDTYEDLPAKYLPRGSPMYYPYGDDEQFCFVEGIDWGICFMGGDAYYVKGIGGPFFECTDNGPTNSHAKLMYFNKSGEEWGSPLSTTAAERLSANALMAYPNPAAQSFRLNLTEEHYPLQLEMYDLSGRLIAARTLRSVGEEISLNGLAKGVVVLRATSRDGGIAYGKLAIE